MQCEKQIERRVHVTDRKLVTLKEKVTKMFCVSFKIPLKVIYKVIYVIKVTLF